MSNLNEAIHSAINSALCNIHTALPGQVESYDHTKQEANVKPLIKKEYLDGKIEALPVIVSVPVIFPRSGNASLTFPVNQGDGVLLIFSERAMEKFLSLGGDQEPGDVRKFDLSDAIAFPGLYPFSVGSLSENNNDVLLKYGSGRVQITGSDTKIEFGTGKFKLTDGTVALGTSTNELVQLIVDLIGVLKVLAVDPGTHIILGTTVTALEGVETDLNSIKGSL